MNDEQQHQIFRAPGIYPGILNSEYHSETPPYSSSIIKKMDVPAVARWNLDNPQPYKDVYRIGSAIHKYLLERSEFETEFLTGLDVRRQSNAQKEEWAHWFYEHGADGSYIISHPAAEWERLFEASTGKHIVKPKEIAKFGMMAESVAGNPNAMRLLEGGQAESSVYWQDSETALQLRCRPDYLNAFCSDLKSAESADPRLFGKAIHNMGYHISAAMYQEGLREVTGEIHPFLFIAIEKTPPYLCAVYKMDDAAEELGKNLFRHYLRRLANCLHTGEWPGLQDNFSLPLPTYAYHAEEDQYLQQMER